MNVDYEETAMININSTVFAGSLQLNVKFINCHLSTTFFKGRELWDLPVAGVELNARDTNKEESRTSFIANT